MQAIKVSERDEAIFKLMSEFGSKTFFEVLEKTFWYGKKVPKQQARDRVSKLIKKHKILRLVKTDLMTPRSAITFTDFGKRWVLENLDIEVPYFFLSPVTTWHSIYEQIAYFWLEKSGREVSHTIVKKWSVEHRHTPDLLYFHKGKPVYVEIELNPKTPAKYLEIFKKSEDDGIHAIIYIFKDEKKMQQLGRKLPTHEKLYITNIENLILNVSKNGKIGVLKQIDFLKSIK